MSNEENSQVESGENSESQNNADGENHSNEETLQAQKKHWRDKATKFQEENDKMKKELEELRAKGSEKKEDNKTNERSDEVDYSKIAFLNSVDVRHADDQKAVMEEAERLKLPLTDVLNMPHIKDKLKDAKNQRKVEEGMPSGDGSSNSRTKGDVDYWVNKKNKDGSYQTPEDPELAAKVIDARIKREERDSMFDPIR